MQIFEASIWYRREQGRGHSYIVPGYRGEIISGLEDGRMIYTGVCATRDEVKRELIAHLKRFGYTGTLRIV